MLGSHSEAVCLGVCPLASNQGGRWWFGKLKVNGVKRKYRRPKAYTRGSARGLDDNPSDTEAIALATTAMFAKGGWKSHRSRVRWWVARCSVELRGITPFPLTPDKVVRSAGLFIQGGYRSGRNYLSSLKREHIMRGHDISAQLALALTDSARAVSRDLGPAQQADEINVAALELLTEDQAGSG